MRRSAFLRRIRPLADQPRSQALRSIVRQLDGDRLWPAFFAVGSFENDDGDEVCDVIRQAVILWRSPPRWDTIWVVVAIEAGPRDFRPFLLTLDGFDAEERIENCCRAQYEDDLCHDFVAVLGPGGIPAIKIGQARLCRPEVADQVDHWKSVLVSYIANRPPFAR